MTTRSGEVVTNTMEGQEWNTKGTKQLVIILQISYIIIMNYIIMAMIQHA